MIREGEINAVFSLLHTPWQIVLMTMAVNAMLQTVSVVFGTDFSEAVPEQMPTNISKEEEEEEQQQEEQQEQ